MLRAINDNNSMGTLLSALSEHKDKILNIDLSYKPTKNFEYLYVTIRLKESISEEVYKEFYQLVKQNTIDLYSPPYRYSELQGNTNTREISFIQILYL